MKCVNIFYPFFEDVKALKSKETWEVSNQGITELVSSFAKVQFANDFKRSALINTKTKLQRRYQNQCIIFIYIL